MDFYEFFAGGGMARIGFGPDWHCLFANDIDGSKAKSYQQHFDGGRELHVHDIAEILPSQLPGHADLAWASFPCQDLSLAGCRGGLKSKRSGMFWPFWRLIQSLNTENRAPRMVVLENVYGAITSHEGKDFATICEALTKEGYRYAPLVVDARLFLPQSRPRLFIVGFYHDMASPPDSIVGDGPVSTWHPDAFGRAFDLISQTARDAWLWLDPPTPPTRTSTLTDLIEEAPTGVEWHTPLDTKRLLEMMSPINLAKVEQAKRAKRLMVGAVYKRTRKDGRGTKQQRAEVRFDDVAGCLRTPAGGSSRQIILIVEGQNIRSRLLSPREAARLMGLPENYPLPERYNDAYRLAGDGLAVPVVDWLTRHVIEPSLNALSSREAA